MFSAIGLVNHMHPEPRLSYRTVKLSSPGINGQYFCMPNTAMIQRIHGTDFFAVCFLYLQVPFIFDYKSLAHLAHRHTSMYSRVPVQWKKKLRPLALEMLEFME